MLQFVFTISELKATENFGPSREAAKRVGVQTVTSNAVDLYVRATLEAHGFDLTKPMTREDHADQIIFIQP